MDQFTRASADSRTTFAKFAPPEHAHAGVWTARFSTTVGADLHGLCGQQTQLIGRFYETFADAGRTPGIRTVPAGANFGETWFSSESAAAARELSIRNNINMHRALFCSR